MIKKEYLRYMKAKFNLLLLFIMSIPILGSYYATYLEKLEWMNQLASSAPDLNLELTTKIVNGYNGLAYFDSFIFSSDFYIIFIIISLAGIAIHIGATTFANLHTGYGALLVSRLGYKKYINHIMIAQVMYIATFVLSYLLFVLIVSCLVGGADFDVFNSRLNDIQGVKYVFVLFLHIFLSLIYLTLVFIITSLVTPYFNNKYLIQITPLITYFIPLFIGSTVGNISNFFAVLTSNFVTDNFLLGMYYNSTSFMSLLEVVLSIVSLPLILLTIILFLYDLNLKKYSLDYLK